MYTQASPQLPKLDEGNIYKTGWWFGTCFVFHNIWDNPSHLIFFRGVETTNQKVINITIIPHSPNASPR
jgi:hypothetical protein